MCIEGVGFARNGAGAQKRQKDDVLNDSTYRFVYFSAFCLIYTCCNWRSFPRRDLHIQSRNSFVLVVLMGLSICLFKLASVLKGSPRCVYVFNMAGQSGFEKLAVDLRVFASGHEERLSFIWVKIYQPIRRPQFDIRYTINQCLLSIWRQIIRRHAPSVICKKLYIIYNFIR